MADCAYPGEPLPIIDEQDQESGDGYAQADPEWVALQDSERRVQALHAAMHPSLGCDRPVEDVLAAANKILAFLTGESN
jgi:hypothetical protein